MSPQERAPRKRLAPARGRFDPVVSQDALDRGASHLEAEVAQRSAQAGVTPRGALAGHRQQLLRHVARGRRSPRRAPRVRAIVLRAAIIRRYQRRIVSGKSRESPARPAGSGRALDPSRPGSRRSASVNRRRSCAEAFAQQLRLSTCRYAMASCCRRWIQPAIVEGPEIGNGAAGFEVSA